MTSASATTSDKRVDRDATLKSMLRLFKPSSIAVVGATARAGAVGRTVVENLKESARQLGRETFKLYPVNPGRDEILGVKCYKSVSQCPGTVDVALVITPAETVPAVIEDCGKAGVGNAVVITAGFKEIGEAGLELENRVVEIGRKYGVRIVGPNCLGIMNPYWGMNASFAATNALSGATAFISQSGAMCTAILDWSLKIRLGFSAFVSIGSMADVNWADLLEYLINDENTKTVMIYMETIGDASRFLAAAAPFTRKKPIVVIKAGQTEAAAKAAASHTGSLAGSHDSFLAAMKRAGVMVVDTIPELCDVTLMLGKQPKPKGGNLLIITNAGGPGVLATDAAAMSGAVVCELEQKTIDECNKFLPAPWSHGNPLDILGDASAELYKKTLAVALKDKSADGVLVVLSPQSVTDSTGTAKALVAAYKEMQATGTATKPILCSWMGGAAVEEGSTLLTSEGLPSYSHPDVAAKVFGRVWKYQEALQKFPPVAPPPPAASLEEGLKGVQGVDVATVKGLLQKARSEKRELLTEAESKQLLHAFGIPVAETIVCDSAAKAAAAATRVGYPCVVKLNSETITHKSDVGGVKLNLKDEAGVKKAYDEIKVNVDKIGPKHFQGVTVQPMIDLSNAIEIILGSVNDPQFGNLVLFGTGGVMVEIFRDSALGVPPLNEEQAKRQIESCKIYEALKGCGNQRFPGVFMDGLVKAVVRFSELIYALGPELAECDVNPMVATPKRCIALDARVVLAKKE